MTATPESQQARRPLALDEARTKKLTSKNNEQQRFKPGISVTAAPRSSTTRTIDTDAKIVKRTKNTVHGAGTKTTANRPPLGPVSNTKIKPPHQVVDLTKAESPQPDRRASRPTDQDVNDRRLSGKATNRSESEMKRVRSSMAGCTPNEVLSTKVKQPLQRLPAPSEPQQDRTSDVPKKKRRLSDTVSSVDTRRVRSRPSSPTTPAQEARVVLQDLSDQYGD